MMKGNVFDYTDFKDYLAERFAIVGESRGMRIKFAQLIRSSPSYISKVLSGDIKLPLEYVPTINQLLQHTVEESDFFMQLVLYSQAGSKNLEVYFKEKLDTILQKRQDTALWIPEKEEFPKEVQSIYFSHWCYAIMHTLTLVPKYQTKFAIAERLKLSLSTVTRTLDYLVQVGLLKTKGDRYQMVHTRFHLPTDSAWAAQSHSNIRHYAIQRMTEPSAGDANYSLVFALSQRDREVVRKKIQKLIAEVEGIMKNSPNEEVCAFSVDFLRV